MAPHEDHSYHPSDAIKAGISGTLITGSAGVLISAVQNTLTKQNVSAWGVITRSGGTIASFAAMGGIYEFGRHASANLREKEGAINTAIGGFLAGSILGFRVGTTPAVIGYGALCSIVLGAFDYSGGQLSGYRKEAGVDDFDRKNFLRKNRRRPIEETVEQLGEGRGIYGPGYAERRAQRIKEAYGIDVPVNSSS